MITADPKKCDYCGACVACCPVNCIEVDDDAWMVDDDICTHCGTCVSLCPMRALSDD